MADASVYTLSSTPRLKPPSNKQNHHWQAVSHCVNTLITSSQHYDNIRQPLKGNTSPCVVSCRRKSRPSTVKSLSLFHVIIPLIPFPLWNGDSGSGWGSGSWCIVGMTTMLEKRRGESLVVVAAAVVWMMEPLHSSESWQISLLVLSRFLHPHVSRFLHPHVSLSISTLMGRYIYLKIWTDSEIYK